MNENECTIHEYLSNGGEKYIQGVLAAERGLKISNETMMASRGNQQFRVARIERLEDALGSLTRGDRDVTAKEPLVETTSETGKYTEAAVKRVLKTLVSSQ